MLVYKPCILCINDIRVYRFVYLPPVLGVILPIRGSALPSVTAAEGIVFSIGTNGKSTST